MNTFYPKRKILVSMTAAAASSATLPQKSFCDDCEIDIDMNLTINGNDDICDDSINSER